jgi:hypothetical protein
MLPPVSNTLDKSICYGKKRYVNCRLRVVFAYNSKKQEKCVILQPKENLRHQKVVICESEGGSK